MSDHTLKSFAGLHDDYAFFESHASETEASLASWLPLVQNRWAAPRVLDFGAGSGSFSSLFLRRAGFPPANLDLTLVEPDPAFRSRALQTLAPLSSHPIHAWPLLDHDLGPTFDLIFSHHVLYYVPNLEQTLNRLCDALAPAGRMLLIQGGQGNGLNKIVFAAFAHLGELPPYHYSENTRAYLRTLGVELKVRQVHSTLDFPDSVEGRRRILRFLLSEHLARLPESFALSLFEPFVQGRRVRIPSVDELFIVDAPLEAA